MYSYLRLSFCANDNFSNSKRILIEKCRRCIFATKNFPDFQKLSIDTCNKLFNTLFKPTLLYTSEVWGAYDKLNLNKWEQDPVERFQLYSLGLSKKASNIVPRKEVGQTSLNPTIYLNVLKFQQHLEDLPENSIAKQRLIISITLANTGKSFLYLFRIPNTLTVLQRRNKHNRT